MDALTWLPAKGKTAGNFNLAIREDFENKKANEKTFITRQRRQEGVPS